MLALWFLAVVTGCGGAQHTDAARPLPPFDALCALPTGATTVARLEPDAVMADPGLRALLDVVVPRRRESLVRARFGFALGEAKEIVWASYDGGELLLVTLDGAAADAVRAGAAHMDVERSSDAPVTRRGGFSGKVPRELVAIREHTLVVGSGDLTPLYDLLRTEFELREGAESTACMGAIPEDLPARGAGSVAPFTVWWPEPLALPEDAPIALLLAEERSMRVTLRPAGEQAIVHVTLRGAFPRTAPDNFRALVAAVASSSFARLFGLERLPETLEVQSAPGGIELEARVLSDKVADGLRTAFTAETSDLVGLLADE
ncbi:MAG: hypothetical protein R3A78_06730 [Polyangiales bacterium]|nr:hypothetical protein [Myxococcales bacterium]